MLQVTLFLYLARNSEEFTGGGKSWNNCSLLLRIRDSRSNKKQVITKLCKHCPLSTKFPQKQRNKHFNAYLYLSAIRRKSQKKEIRLLSTIHFFVTSSTSNRKVKQTFNTVLR